MTKRGRFISKQMIMKKQLILAAMILCGTNAMAQNVMTVHKSDGTKEEYKVSDVVEVTFDTRDEDKGDFVDNGDGTGTLNGYEWVDLGLPSGLKWAACNIGAESPSEIGCYFAWGETDEKGEYTQENSETTGLTKFTLKKKGYIDAKGILTAEHDAATVNLGTGWRMPTNDDLEELKEYCTLEKDDANTHFILTGPNGKKLIFRFSRFKKENKVWYGTAVDSYVGITFKDYYYYCWSSNVASDGVSATYDTAYSMHLGYSYVKDPGYSLEEGYYAFITEDTSGSGYYRYCGLPIRAVTSVK